MSYYRPSIPTQRSEGSPFQVEVHRGLLGLGLTVTMNSLCGQISVKSMTNRSPLTKDGRLRYIILIVSFKLYKCMSTLSIQMKVIVYIF